MNIDQSKRLFAQAQDCFPNGVNRIEESFHLNGNQKIYFKSGKGAYLFDVDDNRYLDFNMSGGTQILGHQSKEVNAAIKEQVEQGFALGAQSELETEFATFLKENLPQVERLRFFSTVTEAVVLGIRIARASSKRNKIIKFEGCIHGEADLFYIKSALEVEAFRNPIGEGVSHEGVKDTLVATYNNIEQVEALFKNYAGEVAAVIVEPVSTQFGCVLPELDFLQNLKSLCQTNGSVLIFDETKTGFRLGFGGAQEKYGITADLSLYAGILGGGLPLAALAGKSELMNLLAPYGDVAQYKATGDLSLAMRAGLTTLKTLKNHPEYYSRMDDLAEKLDFGIGQSLNKKNIFHRLNRVGSILSLYFHVGRVSNFSEAQKANHALYNSLFQHFLEHGILLPLHDHQPWYLCQQITEEAIAKTISVLEKFSYYN